jgi:hypothetical protein
LPFQGKVHQKSIAWLEHFAAAHQKAHNYDSAILILTRGLRFLDLTTSEDVMTPATAESREFEEVQVQVCTYSCCFHAQLAVLYSERHMHNRAGKGAGKEQVVPDVTRHFAFCTVLAQQMIAAGKLLRKGSAADKVNLFTKCCHKMWRNVARAKKLASFWVQENGVKQEAWSATFDAFATFAEMSAICRSLDSGVSQLSGDMQASCLCAAASARCRMLACDKPSHASKHVEEIFTVLDRALDAISDESDQMYAIAQKFYQLAVQLYEMRSFDSTILAIGRACEIARAWASATLAAGDVSVFWGKSQISQWYTILAACLREEHRLQESVAAAAAAVAFFPELHRELPQDLVENWMKMWLNCVSNSNTGDKPRRKQSPPLACTNFTNSSTGVLSNASLLDVVLSVSNLRQPVLSVDAIGRVLCAEASAYRFHLGKHLGKLSTRGTPEMQVPISVAVARSCLSGHDHVINYATDFLYKGGNFAMAHAHILADAARADVLVSTYEMAAQTSAVQHHAVLQDEADGMNQLADRAMDRVHLALDIIQKNQCEVNGTNEAHMHLISAWISWELALPQKRATRDKDTGDCSKDKTKASVLQSQAMQELDCALQILETDDAWIDADTSHEEQSDSAQARTWTTESSLPRIISQLQSFAALCGILHEVEFEIRTRQAILSMAKHLMQQPRSTPTELVQTSQSMPEFEVAAGLINLSRTYLEIGLNKTANDCVDEASKHLRADLTDEDDIDEHTCLVLSQWHTLRGCVHTKEKEGGQTDAEQQLLKARQYLKRERMSDRNRLLQQLTLAWNHHVMSTNYCAQSRVHDAVQEAQLCVIACLEASAEDCKERSTKPLMVSALGCAVSTRLFTSPHSSNCEGGANSYLLFSTLSQGLKALGCLWELLGVPRRADWCFRQGDTLGKNLGSSAQQRRFSRLSCVLATKSYQLEDAKRLLQDAANEVHTGADLQHVHSVPSAALRAREAHKIHRSREAVRLLLLEGCLYRKTKEYESAWGCFQAAEKELMRCLKSCAAFSGSSRALKKGADFISMYGLKTLVCYLQARTRHAQANLGVAKKMYKTVIKDDNPHVDPRLRASALYHLALINIHDAEASNQAVQRKWMCNRKKSDVMCNGAADVDSCLDVSRDYLLQALSLVKLSASPKLHRRICNALATITGRCASSAESAAESAFFISAAIGVRFHSEMRMVALQTKCCDTSGKDMNESGSVLTCALQQLSSAEDALEGDAWITEQASLLPPEWIVVNISLTEQSELLVSRLQKNTKPIVLRLPVEFEDLSDEFKSIIATCQESMTGYTSEQACSWSKQQKSSWWKQRQKLDAQLGKLLAQMQSSWFKHWHFVLGAPIADGALQKEVDMICEEVMGSVSSTYGVEVDRALMHLCISNCILLSEEEMQQVLGDLLGEEASNLQELQQSIQKKYAQAWERAKESNQTENMSASSRNDEHGDEDCTHVADTIADKVDAVSKMKVAELKKCLSDRNLKTTGEQKIHRVILFSHFPPPSLGR